MIILIAGASHTGKTLLAQRLLEKYHYPYLSIDHLKMGMIRSGNTDLTPMDDDKLTPYLWPIVREMIKTAIENGQNLIVEGCYIPFDWKKDFAPEYLRHIRYRCLIMSRKYIESHFEDIRSHGSDIEQRMDDSGLNMDELARDNEKNLRLCKENDCAFILLDEDYDIGLEEILFDHCVTAARFEDMALAADIMVTSFRTAFADFVSPETMRASTNPDNCRAMLEHIYQEGKMHFLMGGDQGFLCWQETGDGAEIVAIHSLPVSWGTGLGRAMLTEALKQIGDRPVYLWAFKENARARRFYEKHDFHWDGTDRISEFDGALEVRYVRSPVQLLRAEESDAEVVRDMQQEAFAELLERYQDHDMSPATEPLEKIRWKITHPGSYYYFILAGGQTVGAIRVLDLKDGSRKRISPLYIMPDHRGKGYAQAAMVEAQRIHGTSHWKLDTILQEAGNCYLYEKMGYHQTGHRTVIKENMTIVDYEKD